MDKTKAIVALLSGISGLALALLSCFRDSHTKEYLRTVETLSSGFALSEIIDDFKKSTSRYPSSAELIAEAAKFYKSFPSEVMSDSPSNRIVSNLDGRGGWVYSPESGCLRVNSLKPLQIDSHASLVPSDIQMRPKIVPIIGERHSIERRSRQLVERFERFGVLRTKESPGATEPIGPQ